MNYECPSCNEELSPAQFHHSIRGCNPTSKWLSIHSHFNCPKCNATLERTPDGSGFGSGLFFLAASTLGYLIYTSHFQIQLKLALAGAAACGLVGLGFGLRRVRPAPTRRYQAHSCKEF